MTKDTKNEMLWLSYDQCVCLFTPSALLFCSQMSLNLTMLAEILPLEFFKYVGSYST